jgi:Short C-terminal domain
MPGLLRGLARTAIIAGTATAVSNRVSRRQANRWARQDQQREPDQPAEYATEPGGPDPQPGGSMDDTLAQLKELGELKSQGVLTEAEFAQQKSRILGT